MALEIDLKDLKDAGFDKYLSRTAYGTKEDYLGGDPRYMSARNISGGSFGKTTVIRVGLIKIDGANGRIIINDGTNDRVAIGNLDF